MKKIFTYIAVLTASLLAFSCSLDFVKPDQNALPQASSLTPIITVDQETNYVTFAIADEGVVPVWIFGDEKIDGKASKKYAYTLNGLTLRIREAGTHSVELKAYNANGLSQGSQTVTFSLNNTYRDPFDPSPYMKAIANTWVWDADNAGHFGCGEPGTDGTNWWSAGPHEKDGCSLYDDRMTFDTEGNYTYDPVDGYVYVNKDSGYKPEYYAGDDQDYQAPIDAYTHKYSIENNWNDAGIEEIYLVLQDGDNLSYIPNPEALTNPTYRFLKTSTSDMKKNMVLAVDNGGIAWHYSFIPYVKGIGPEELLAGTTADGKAWIMDADTRGHLGCGPGHDDPASWWSAGPHEKDGCGMYDDVLTFFPDGKYIFDPGEGGTIYVNKDVTALGGPQGEDFQVDWEIQESSYAFDGETLQLPAGVVLGYVPNDVAYSEAVYSIVSITETQMVVVQDADGISWQYIFKARDITPPEKSIGGQAVEGGKVELSLTKGDNIPVTGIDLSTYWTDPDFFEYVDAGNLKFVAESGEYRIYDQNNWLKCIPMSGGDPATYEDGGALWIIGEGLAKPQGGTVPGWTTDPSVDLPFAKVGDHQYKMTVYVTGPNFKIFGQPNWGLEFGGENYGEVELNDYFTIHGYPGGVDSDNGNIWSGDSFEEGWYVIEITDNDGTLDMTIDKKRETYYDIEGETNLWRTAKIDEEYWYSPASWAGGISPEAEVGEHNNFIATIPDGVGGSEWMAQNKLKSGISTDASKIYDFCCTITADEDMTITIKLTGDPEEDNDIHSFFYNGGVSLTAGEPLVFKMPKIANKEVGTDNLMLILDFGRSPIGSTIEVKDICFQEHLER